ncbi:MAG TPA: hypothetical protein VGB99_13015 [Acidobacteriota bacterium]
MHALLWTLVLCGPATAERLYVLGTQLYHGSPETGLSAFGPISGYGDYDALTARVRPGNALGIPAGPFLLETSDFDRLAAALASYRINLLRTFLAGYSNINYVTGAPTEPRGAGLNWRDHQPFVLAQGRYDLNRLDPTFVARLQNWVAFAGAAIGPDGLPAPILTVVVLVNRLELIRSGNGERRAWDNSPWNARNNASGVIANSSSGLADFIAAADPFPTAQELQLRALQENYVKRIVEALRGQPYVLFEPMNEPEIRDGATAEAIARWLNLCGRWIHEADPSRYVLTELYRRDGFDPLNYLDVESEYPYVYDLPHADILQLLGDQWMNRRDPDRHERMEVKLERISPSSLYRRYLRPIFLDDDGSTFPYPGESGRARDDPGRVARDWARRAWAAGASFNHKDNYGTTDPPGDAWDYPFREALSLFGSGGVFDLETLSALRQEIQRAEPPAAIPDRIAFDLEPIGVAPALRSGDSLLCKLTLLNRTNEPQPILVSLRYQDSSGAEHIGEHFLYTVPPAAQWIELPLAIPFSPPPGVLPGTVYFHLVAEEPIAAPTQDRSDDLDRDVLEVAYET